MNMPIGEITGGQVTAGDSARRLVTAGDSALSPLFPIDCQQLIVPVTVVTLFSGDDLYRKTSSSQRVGSYRRKQYPPKGVTAVTSTIKSWYAFNKAGDSAIGSPSSTLSPVISIVVATTNRVTAVTG